MAFSLPVSPPGALPGGAAGLGQETGAGTQGIGGTDLFALLLSGRLDLQRAGAAPPFQDPTHGAMLPGTGKGLPPGLAGRLQALAPTLSAGLARGELPEETAQWLEQLAAAGPLAQAPGPLVPGTAGGVATAGGDGGVLLAGTGLGRTVTEAPHVASAAEGREVAAYTALEGPPRGEASARPAATALPLEPPVGQRGWDQALGSRIVWMTGERLHNAQLHLNPPQLGPLEVRLSVHPDQSANVTFLSQHAGVRDALEAAIPRLREMLAEAGVNLADANVSDQQPRPQTGEGRGEGSPFAEGDAQVPAAGAETEGDAGRGAPLTTGQGLIDCFV